jgi:hypothetical protein
MVPSPTRRREGDDTCRQEILRPEAEMQLFFGKPAPHMTHLVEQVLSVVRHHVYDDESSAGLQHPVGFCDRQLGLDDIVKHEKRNAMSSDSSSMGSASSSPLRTTTFSNEARRFRAAPIIAA